MPACSVRLAAPDESRALSEEAELALFRALQEALSNVVRHTGATRVWVSLGERDGGVELSIRDDGPRREKELDLDLDRLQREGHMGLAGMRERLVALGGTLAIERAPEGGVRLEVRVPYRTEIVQ